MTTQQSAPYFYRQGRMAELRIPLNLQERASVRQFIKAIPDDEGAFALFVAESGIGILDVLINPNDEGGAAYADYLAATPQNRLSILTRLHRLGWVSNVSLDEARKEAETWTRSGCPRIPSAWDNLAADIRGSIKKGGRDADEIHRLQALLGEIEEKIKIEAA